MDERFACGEVQEIGQRQGGHREDLFGLHMESRPTGHQQLQVWASRQQFLQVGSHRHHLLDVVQQQQLLPVAQGFLQLLQQRSGSTLSDVKHLGDG